MARQYTLRRRAERQADTRRRIVEATLDLHTEVGPARTSISAIAERAGVQRHTVYAHFPEERSLFMACSGLSLERDPLPDAAGWGAIADPHERLRAGLADLYGWFARNESLAASVFRDAEVDPLTAEIVDLRIGSWLRAAEEDLSEGLAGSPAARAMVGLALSFHAWRSLAREGGLDDAAAAGAMVDAVRALGGPSKKSGGRLPAANLRPSGSATTPIAPLSAWSRPPE